MPLKIDLMSYGTASAVSQNATSGDRDRRLRKVDMPGSLFGLPEPPFSGCMTILLLPGGGRAARKASPTVSCKYTGVHTTRMQLGRVWWPAVTF